MYKKLFYLVILLAFTFILTVPTGSVAAKGVNHVDFTATSVNFCAMGGQDPFCDPGEYVPLHNGIGLVIGYQTVMKFTATDPRWNADCYFVSNPFLSGLESFRMSGSFTCYPSDPQYAGGWWKGTVLNTFLPDKAISRWSAKGYGKLDKLLVINVYGELDADGSFHNSGTIIELPGYQP
jgi:hypothetical protein